MLVVAFGNEQGLHVGYFSGVSRNPYISFDGLTTKEPKPNKKYTLKQREGFPPETVTLKVKLVNGRWVRCAG